MPGINQATLLGNVGKDPEVRRFQDGGSLVTFSIATSETWRDKNSGEKKEKTQWHSIVVKNDGLCKVVEQYVKKGDKIFVQGQIETRKWQDQNGNDKYSTEIVLGPFNSRLELLSSRNSGDQGGREERGSDDQRGRSMPSGNSGRAYGMTREQAMGPAVDDEIPF